VSDEDHERGGTGDLWFRAVGDVAAPLLAGFSFTAVITLSNDTGHLRWSGITLLAFTVATVSLITSLQFSKYARDKDRSAAARERSEVLTRSSYRVGIIMVLLGLGFTLAPQHVTGLQGTLQWVASGLAFAAGVVSAALSIPVVNELVTSK
jgi:hypothetical protein